MVDRDIPTAPNARRARLYDMDLAIQSLGRRLGDASVVSLTGAHHNLIGMWAEV